MGFVGECPESVNQWEIRPEVEYPRCRNMGHVAHSQICDHFIQPRLTVTRESCARVTFVFEYLLHPYTVVNYFPTSLFRCFRLVHGTRQLILVCCDM